MKDSPSFVTWVGWISATAVAAATLVGFAYNNFTTKVEQTSYQESLEKRLDRLETKIDKILLKD